MVHKRIRSAAQAQAESEALKSYWSQESRLSQRILIYCAELLERVAAKKPKRKPTAYQKFLSSRLTAGRTMLEAVTEWKLKGRKH